MAWYALVFASVPAMFFACGGRSDLGLEEEEGPQVAGRGGSSGKAGNTGTSGKAGTSSGGTSGGGGNMGGGGITGAGGAAQGGASQGGKAGSTGGSSGTSGKGGGGKGGSGKGGTGSGGKDLFDSGIPIPDSGPIGECAQCIASKCDDSINACYNDPDCLSGIQCSVTMCLAGGGMGGSGGSGGGGGGLDFQCILGCFNGDFGAALTVVQAFQCITGTCGSVCSNLIPGGGGDGGQAFGGGPGGPGGGQGQGGMTGGMGMGGGGPGMPPGMGGMNGGPGGPPQPASVELDPFGGGSFSPYLAPGEMWIGETRVPYPEEVPGYPDLSDALRRP